MESAAMADVQITTYGKREEQQSITTTSADFNPQQFFALKPDVSSPPEPLVTLASSQHGNTQEVFSTSTASTSTYTASSMTEDQSSTMVPTQGRHPSLRDSAETQSHQGVTGMPFQSYSSNKGNQVYPGFQGNQNYQVNQSYHNNASFRGISNPNTQGPNVSMPIHMTTSSVTSNPIPNHTLDSRHPNLSAMSSELEHPSHTQPHQQRHVSMRLEPSFLETLAKEAEQLGGYQGSQNSSMMSEYDGMTPLLPDTSMSTVTGDVTHGNMTELSVGPLSEQSQYSDMSRLTMGRLSEVHHPTARQGTSLQSHEMNLSTMSERPKEEERQQELQKYLCMLLQQSPGSSRAEETMTDRSKKTPPSQDHSLNTTPTKTQPSPLQFRGQGQAHPAGVAFTKTMVPSSGLPRPEFGDAGQAQDLGTDSGTPLGVLSPGQVGEISRLLGIYRSRAAADPSALEGHGPTQEELYAYVNDPQHRGSASVAKPHPSPQKGLSSQTTHQGPEVPIKERPGQQQQRGPAQKVIKVPTGTDAASVRNSPPRPKPATRGPVKAPAGRPGAPPNKPDRKTAPGDKKDKPKGSAKVWK